MFFCFVLIFFFFFFLYSMFKDDDVKTYDLELNFCKFFQYKCFCKKSVWSGIFSLWSERSRIWSDIYFCLEFCFYPIGQNVQCAFCLVGQILVLVRHFPMSDRYFKACMCLRVHVQLHASNGED